MKLLGQLFFMLPIVQLSSTLDRNVINLKDSLMPRFAQLAYNDFGSGQMELLLSLGKQSQGRVSGTVRLELHKELHGYWA